MSAPYLPLALVVPARLASQRFPRKLLHPIGGRPVLRWTLAAARRAAPGLPVFVAVAEAELFDLVSAWGFDAILTDPALPSGTDRLAQANQQIGARRLINLQADEPLIRPRHLSQLIELIQRPGVDMATLASPFGTIEDFRDPSKVKVVCGVGGRALYFSRSPIPFERDTGGQSPDLARLPALWHMGLYAYTADFLRRFASLPPGHLEQIEKLEQLRALENGCTIAVGISPFRTLGVDTPEDVARVEAALALAP